MGGMGSALLIRNSDCCGRDGVRAVDKVLGLLWEGWGPRC